MKEGGGWVDGWRIWSASVVVVMAMLGEGEHVVVISSEAEYCK